MTAVELKDFTEAADHVVIDVRQGRSFTEGHISGALSAPYRQQGWSVPVANWIKQQGRDLAIAIFADNAIVANAASEALKAQNVIVKGTFDGGIDAWQAAGYPIVSVKAITVDELAGSLDDWTVIDVREPYELRSGVVPGAKAIPLGNLESEAPQLPKDKRYAVICASGNRSQSAASYLAEEGFQVANVVGGMSLWIGGGHPVDR